MSPDGTTGVAETARAALGSVPRPGLTEIFVHGTRLLAAPPLSDPMRIAIAGSTTTDLIARAVAVAAVQEGFRPAITQSPYGAWRQEALDTGSALHRAKPALVVLATDWRDGIAALSLNATQSDAAAATAECAAGFRRVWDAIRMASPDARIVQHLPALPPSRLTGIAEARTPASPRRQIESLRAALLDAGPDIVFLDTEGLAPDSGAWFAAKLSFAQSALPEYTARFRAALRTVSGRAKKVLVLDLDNTLWGGVIGDDGVEGIELGPDTPRGEAFAAFQSYVKSLAARGIVLAVCSKNDPVIAATGLAHPHSVMVEGDFAAIECSWSDKAGGLRRIAERLNLGLESFVFADDNPAECALVAASLPEVAVVPLGEDPAEFVSLLEEGCWFDAQALSAEDLARGAAYRARAEAEVAAAEATDLKGFLTGLAMRGRVFRPEGAALARVAQLEGKTNQFNLTTRRYDDAAVAAFAARADAVVLAATLADKFGDHGLVSSLIATVQGDTLVIESWVMSCRVFSRTLEQFMLRAVLAEAGRRGLAHIVGLYAPTLKNRMVADLYPRLGFAPAGEGRWHRDSLPPAGDLETFIAPG